MAIAILSIKEREALRKRVEEFIVKNPKAGSSVIVKHFMAEVFKRSTIYNAINRLRTTSPIEYRPRPGRPTQWTKNKVKCWLMM